MRFPILIKTLKKLYLPLGVITMVTISIVAYNMIPTLQEEEGNPLLGIIIALQIFIFLIIGSLLHHVKNE